MTIPSLVYADRYLNKGTRTYSRHADYTEAEDKYRPDSPHPYFDLPVFELPCEDMHVYTADPEITLKNIYLPEDKVLFFIHPQVLEKCGKDPYVEKTLSIATGRNSITVSPSSSTRTLYVEKGDISHALKVHFPFRISRYGRKMRHEVLEQAINISRELERGIGRMDDRFAFLREVIGVSHKNLDHDSPRQENWGYLIREMKPFPLVPGQRTLIPGFSLYGGDFFDPGKKPLLADLIADQNPKYFILENIMLPIIRHWVSCFLSFGYLLEPHGQNVLLEIGTDKNIERIVHRDLSLGIYMRRRRHIHLSEEHLNAYNRMETNDFLSITYDKFMGGHFFDRIVALSMKIFPHLTHEDFIGPCRDEFSLVFPDHKTYFPGTVRYFSEKRDQFNKPLYLDTGESPKWRP